MAASLEERLRTAEQNSKSILEENQTLLQKAHGSFHPGCEGSEFHSGMTPLQKGSWVGNLSDVLQIGELWNDIYYDSSRSDARFRKKMHAI